MNRGKSALTEISSIPRDGDDPVFPAPWAATAFAMTVALHEQGRFSWAEWAERLGASIAAADQDSGTDPEAYWRCWMTALEETITASGIAAAANLDDLRSAWRDAAAATPHGEPIALADDVRKLLRAPD